VLFEETTFEFELLRSIHETAQLGCRELIPTRGPNLGARWRKEERYVIRDVAGRPVTADEGRRICKERYAIPRRSGDLGGASAKHRS
jgi:hypothetical protein